MKQIFCKLKRILRIINFKGSAYDFFCDIKYGIETRKIDMLPENKKAHFYYMPTSYFIIKKIFKKYPFKSEDHLVDFGCGKGRVIIEAIKHHCLYITAIEINKNMVKIAEKNIIIFNKRKINQSQIEIINLDAIEMEINNTMNRFFFFNPFHLKIFICIIDKITCSVKQYPRKVLLFFLWPQESTINLMQNFIEYKMIEKYDNDSCKYYIYESN